jgi:hypothetical protein
LDLTRAKETLDFVLELDLGATKSVATIPFSYDKSLVKLAQKP